MPPACILILYAAGVLAARRRPALGKWLRHGAVVLLYLLSTGTGAWLLAYPLETMEPPLDARAMKTAQAIVVLTASRIKHSPEYGERSVPDFIALERMAYGAHLARSSGLPLLVSGGLISDDPDDEPLALGMKRMFDSSFGVPVRWVEAASTNTAENARLSAAMLKRDGVTRIVLVTDAMHMRRARIAFERAGLAVTSGPTFYTTARGFDPLELTPKANNLRRSSYAMYEWLGLARYQFH
ncbi:YdcF family protein [Massilia sp. R2A-15]|uniref:YdcF family protein n=1 Tax=Massilia sp. R2A-15 TaxID=3064278 RepID=UPI0027336BA3|nr:YdcF family protein [Massilia sp. R2A-15]WLI88927.1 YdcF family protein [Massilia sp. R2A-15]